MNRQRRSARTLRPRWLATFCWSLVLTVLVASTAQGLSVLEVEVDPGEIGSLALDLPFETPIGIYDVIVLRFSDGKQLGFPGEAPPKMGFQIRDLNTLNGVGTAGHLIDENDRAIPGTHFAGLGLGSTNVPTGEGEEFPEDTLFSGFLFTGLFGQESSGVAYRVNWVEASTPTVVPEPGTALLMGLGLAGLAAADGRRRRATSI